MLPSTFTVEICDFSEAALEMGMLEPRLEQSNNYRGICKVCKERQVSENASIANGKFRYYSLKAARTHRSDGW